MRRPKHTAASGTVIVHRSRTPLGLLGRGVTLDGYGQAMHIITRTRLTEFGLKHAEASGPLRDWASIMRRKTYTEHLQVQQDFSTVDFIGPRRAVFNICGNAYRLVVDLRYDLRRVYVRHVVTHAEYDRLMKRGLL